MINKIKNAFKVKKEADSGVSPKVKSEDKSEVKSENKSGIEPNVKSEDKSEVEPEVEPRIEQQSSITFKMGYDKEQDLHFLEAQSDYHKNIFQRYYYEVLDQALIEGMPTHILEITASKLQEELLKRKISRSDKKD